MGSIPGPLSSDIHKDRRISLRSQSASRKSNSHASGPEVEHVYAHLHKRIQREKERDREREREKDIYIYTSIHIYMYIRKYTYLETCPYGSKYPNNRHLLKTTFSRIPSIETLPYPMFGYFARGSGPRTAKVWDIEPSSSTLWEYLHIGRLKCFCNIITVGFVYGLGLWTKDGYLHLASPSRPMARRRKEPAHRPSDAESRPFAAISGP